MVVDMTSVPSTPRGPAYAASDAGSAAPSVGSVPVEGFQRVVTAVRPAAVAVTSLLRQARPLRVPHRMQVFSGRQGAPTPGPVEGTAALDSTARAACPGLLRLVH